MRSLLCSLIAFVALTVACHAQDPILADAYDQAVVLVEPGDAYETLAQEIAAAEGLRLVDNWIEVLAADPLAVLWVVAPGTVTEERFAQVGIALREHGPVAVGLISGSTIDEARSLWLQQPAAAGSLTSIVPREAGIETHADGSVVASEPVTREGVIAALAEARVVSYQGHGTRSSWHILDGSAESDAVLEREHLPEVDGAVVVAGACQTFKMWSEDSIAVAFADAGAVAYMGYLHSPQGYAFGEPKGFAEARTWQEFPLGVLVAVQNRGLGQGHLAWPYYFMLGDPRNALAEDPPYTVVSDETRGDRRAIQLAGLPAGPVPVFIEGGAEYSHVRVQNGGQAYCGDPFYDADVQMADIGRNKYLLVDSPGGDLGIMLRQETPAWVRIVEPLGDALDHTALIHHTQGSLGPNLVLGAGVWMAVAWRVLRKKVRLTDHLVPAGLAGLVLTAARGAYAFLRAPYLASMYDGYLRTMDVAWEVSVPFLLSSLALTTAAAWLMLNAQRWWGRIVAALLVVAPTSIMAGFWLTFSVGLNALARQQYGAPLYGFAQGLTALVACGVEAALAAVVLKAAWYPRSRKNTVSRPKIDR